MLFVIVIVQLPGLSGKHASALGAEITDRQLVRGVIRARIGGQVQRGRAIDQADDQRQLLRYIAEQRIGGRA